MALYICGSPISGLDFREVKYYTLEPSRPVPGFPDESKLQLLRGDDLSRLQRPLAVLSVCRRAAGGGLGESLACYSLGDSASLKINR